MAITKGDGQVIEGIKRETRENLESEMMRLINAYKESSSHSFLISGFFGTGKTRILSTCRLPVHVDSFDPNGLETIRDEIKAGIVIPDTRWENEDPRSPHVIREWEKEFNRRHRSGYFEHIGTYAIDSFTTFSYALLQEVLRREGFLMKSPRIQDWGAQVSAIIAYTRVFMSLPCDFVATCHLDEVKDEVGGEIKYTLSLTRSLKRDLPPLFEEIYVLDSVRAQSGISYRLLTQSDGKYMARTRLGKEGIFDSVEEPNIKKLLTKAGRPTDDKTVILKE